MDQYFLPGLAIIVLGAGVSYIVLPRMSPYILGSLSLAMLILGIWQHYSMFPYEYRASMVTDLLKQYSGFIILIFLIISAIIGILMAHGGNLPDVSKVIPEMPAMPSMPNIMNSGQGKNNSKGMFNLTGNSSTKNNSNPLAAVVNMAVNGTKNNSKKNNIASPSFKTV